MEACLQTFLGVQVQRCRINTFGLVQQAHALFAYVQRSGQHDYAVSGTHASPLRQHEDRVDLGFDQALAELDGHL